MDKRETIVKKRWYQFVKKLVYKILRSTRIHHIIGELNKIENLAIINKQVTNNGATFYSEASVVNLSNDPSKIIIGNNTHIRGELQLFIFGGKINIGNNCYIGEQTKIRSGENIIIGDDVLISHNVNITDTTAHEADHIERSEGFKNLIKYGHPKDQGSVLTSPVIIENYAWINFNVTILRGVTIGEGAIIASDSVVTKDVPPFVLAAGNPARIIKQLKK